jgi:hypothetical protein
MIWSHPTARGEASDAGGGLAWTAAPGPLQPATVRTAASTGNSADDALMANVHHSGQRRNASSAAMVPEQRKPSHAALGRQPDGALTVRIREASEHMTTAAITPGSAVMFHVSGPVRLTCAAITVFGQ